MFEGKTIYFQVPLNLAPRVFLIFVLFFHVDHLLRVLRIKQAAMIFFFAQACTPEAKHLVFIVSCYYCF